MGRQGAVLMYLVFKWVSGGVVNKLNELKAKNG